MRLKINLLLELKISVWSRNAVLAIRAEALYSYTVNSILDAFNRGKNTKKTGLRNTVLML